MSAPSSAYTGQNLPAHQSGVAKYDNPLALKLPEYGNNIKSLFYLNHLLTVQQGGNSAFLGMVSANPSSLNYRLHNLATRKSKLSTRGPDGQVYYLLNDAGLNTCGFAVASYPVTRFANRFKADINFQSAYYLDTTEYGYELSVNNSGFNRYAIGGFIAARNNANGRYTLYSNAQFNDLVRFRPYIINAEGTFIGDEQYFYAEDLIFSIGGRQRTGSACDYTQEQNVEVWFKNTDYQRLSIVQTFAQTTDIYGYTSDDMNILISTGYYYFDDITRIYYTPNGEFQQYISCSPPPVPKDAELYTQMWDDTHFGVQVNVNSGSGYYNTNITMNGYLALFSSSNQQQGGLDGGDGNFNIYVPAGQGYAIQNTSFYVPNGLPSGWYVKAIITSTTPSALSYNNHF